MCPERPRPGGKSLGNSPDPLELIDTYGADGVRMGMMLAAPAGNDIMWLPHVSVLLRFSFLPAHSHNNMPESGGPTIADG